MKVYFLRHGIAVEAADWKGSERDRRLTGKGRKQMEREAKALAEVGIEVDVIVTSPLERAKATAKIVADALKLREHLTEDERLGEGFNANALACILGDHSGVANIMLVGHEPTMSAVIGQIVGGARIDLKKGGLACVELPDASSRNAELQWLVPPKLLTT